MNSSIIDAALYDVPYFDVMPNNIFIWFEKQFYINKMDIWNSGYDAFVEGMGVSRPDKYALFEHLRIVLMEDFDD